MDGFPVDTWLALRHWVKHMHSNPGRGRVVATDSWEGATMLCRLKSFLSHSGECLWLSLGESRQGWREAGRGWCKCGRRDIAVEGGGGGLRFRDHGHLYSSLICDEVGKEVRHGHEAQQELWQDCGRGSGIKDATLLDLTITLMHSLCGQPCRY